MMMITVNQRRLKSLKKPPKRSKRTINKMTPRRVLAH